MKKNYLKKVFILLIFISAICVNVKAQVKVGKNSKLINSSAMLEIESDSLGFLLPRISLVSISSAVPLKAHVQGMHIYNKTNAFLGTDSALIAGEYYNNGIKWVRIETSGTNWLLGGNTLIQDTVLGTKNAYALRLASNNKVRAVIDTSGNIMGNDYGNNYIHPTSRGIIVQGEGDSILYSASTGASSTTGVFGTGNKVNWTYGSLISGMQNNVTGSRLVVGGRGHNILNSSNLNAVFGYANTLDGGPINGVANLVGGQNNYVATGWNLVGGIRDSVWAFSSLMAGRDNKSRATATNSLTLGTFLINRSANASVIGTYNDTTSTNSLFEIGNGTGAGARSNAMTVLSNGNVGVGTTVPQNRLHVKGQMRVDTLTSGSLATDSVVVVGSNGVLKKTQFNVAPDQALGSIAIFPFSAIPSDYLECNGTAVSRTTFAALFAKIGTIYGVGDGSTTFNLPDLRGEFVRGWDNGRGIDGGRIIGSSQLATNVWAGGSNTGVPVINGGKLTQWESGSGAIGSKIDVNSDAINFTSNIGGSGLMTTAAAYIGLSSSFGYYQTRPRNVAMVYAIKAKESVMVPTSTSTAISAAAAANEPWYNVATNTGATENTQNIYQMGNVGVGTTTPSVSLEVSSKAYAYPIQVKQDTLAAGISLSNSSNVWGLVTLGTSDPAPGVFSIVNRTAGTFPVNITKLGNMGIGTIAPTEKLEVSGNIVSKNTATNNTQIIARNGSNSIISAIYGGNVAYTTTDAPNGLIVQTSSNSTIQFAPNAVSKMVILPSGFVGIGASVPQAKLDVSGAKSTGAGTGTGISNDAPSQVIIPAGSNGTSRQNDWPSSWSGGLSTFDVVGAATFFGSYLTRSDRKLKENILDMNSDVINQVMKLRPVTYTMKERMPEMEGLQYGFIAQEVRELFPTIVTKADDEEKGTIGMNYQALIAPLVKVVQTQQSEIELLKQEIELLKQLIK